MISVAALRRKQKKLLNPHFANQIDGDPLGIQDHHLVTQIAALEDEEKRR